MVVLALAAGDGLLGELQFMIGALRKLFCGDLVVGGLDFLTGPPARQQSSIFGPCVTVIQQVQGSLIVQIANDSARCLNHFLSPG